MKKDFVAPAKAYRKLQFAEGSDSAVYLYGATGYGKTRLVKEYLGERKVLWLSPLDLEWDVLLPGSSLADDSVSCIVLDDLQLLKNEEQKQMLVALAKRSDIWLVMMGRIQIPLWLVPLITEGKLVIITEEDMHLSLEEIKQIAALEHVELEDSVARTFAVNGYGNAYIAVSAIQFLKSGEIFDANLNRMIRSTFVSHLEKNIIPQWSISLQEFLMQLSVVDTFTLPLAVMITGDNHAPAMLEQAFGTGNFLMKEKDGYRFREPVIEALRSRALKVFGVEKYNQYINNAGLYYELQDDYPMALRLYEQSGNQNSVRNILIRSARHHPGTNNIYLLRRYYLALEQKEIETSPVLISVMSMLYSIMMNPEQSEYWYRKLKQYADCAAVPKSHPPMRLSVNIAAESFPE